MKKKIFITGASGFIGSNIARIFAKNKKYEIHVMCRKSTDRWRLKNITPSLIVHEADIIDEKRVKNILKNVNPFAIFHLANIGVYGGFEQDAESVLKVNLLGTYNILRFADDTDCKIIVNTGSSSEYGPKINPMRETDACFPQGMYAISKLASTLLVKDLARKSKIQMINLRIFTPYGPFDSRQRLIPYIIENHLKKKKILLNKKTNVRDYIYIDDVVKAYEKCITNKNNLSGEIINIGSGKEITVDNVVKTLEEIIGKKLDISWGNEIIRYESKIWQADIKKAKEKISWEPKIELREGLQKTVNWYRDIYKNNSL